MKLELLSRAFCVLNCCAARMHLFGSAHRVSFSVFSNETCAFSSCDFCEINLTGHNEKQSVQVASVQGDKKIQALAYKNGARH